MNKSDDCIGDFYNIINNCVSFYKIFSAVAIILYILNVLNLTILKFLSLSIVGFIFISRELSSLVVCNK